MSKFSMFMKANKAEKPNAKYAATKSLCGADGKPLEWEFRHITSKENMAIQDAATVEVPVAGKSNQSRIKLKPALYNQKLVAASVVFPDLYDKELQDSYGVTTPEELLLELVDDPGEFNELTRFVMGFQGFDSSFEDKVDEAKN